MHKRSSIKRSLNEMRQAEKTLSGRGVNGEVPPIKNQAAVELGRLGGLKGGKARAEKLSAKKRKEIARQAALARWSK